MRDRSWLPSLAAIGACVYVGGLLTALEPDLPLVALAVVAAFVAGSRPSPRRAALSSLLALAALAFVVATVVSSAASADVWRSLRLSTPMLPGSLLFLLIAGYFEGEDDVSVLYLAWSAVGLALAASVLLTAWRSGPMDPTRLVTTLDSPLLVVPNDCALLAVVAPLSLALLRSDRGRLLRAVAGLSMVVSAAAIGMLQSRIAALSMVVALACGVVAGGRGLALGWVGAVLVTALVVDGARGFPLVAKFAVSSPWNSRLALWLAALAMFRDAPLLGHGPHTFSLLYRPYLDALRLPPWLPVDDRVVPWPHNLVLEALAEQGVVGFGALVLLLAGGLVASWKMCHTPGRDTRTLAAGAFGGLVAFLVAATTELSLLRHWVVVFLLTISGVIVHIASPAPSREEPRPCPDLVAT